MRTKTRGHFTDQIVAVTVYNDVQISYDELRSKFCFTVDGNYFTADSLGDAKFKIDNPPKQKIPWTRAKGFTFSHWTKDGLATGEITSIVGAGAPGGADCWFVSDQGRQRHVASLVYLDTPANRELLAKVRELDRQSDELEKQRKQIVKQMLTVADFLKQAKASS